MPSSAHPLSPARPSNPDRRSLRRGSRGSGPGALLALPLLLSLLLLAGCGGDALPEGLTEGDRLLDFEVEDIYRVGRVEGGTWDSFTRISSMAFGDDGRLHLLDPQQRRVHVVSPEGAHLVSFGTQGDGPGELRSPVGVQVLADGRIAVADNGHQAFLLFTPSGEFIRSYRYGPGSALPGASLFRQGTDALVAHGQGFRLEASPGGGPPALPTTTPVRRWALDPATDEVEVTLLAEAWRPEREQRPGQTMVGGRAMVAMAAPRALEPQVHFAPLPDGRFALADSSAYRIRVYGPEGVAGEAPRTVGREVAPVPVTPAIEEEERERRLAELEAGGGPQIQIATSGPGGGTQVVPQSQIQDMLREQVAQVTFWHEIPVIARLAADQEGRLWVERSGGIGQEGPIDLLTVEGDYLGSIPPGGIRTPMAFGPGGLAAWVELDELEVATVRVGRIRVE